MREYFQWRLVVALPAALILAVAPPAARAEDKPMTCAEVLDAISDASDISKPQSYHFEMFVWDKSVGYTAMSLTPRTGEDDGGYVLSVESVVQMPRSSTITTEVTAGLSLRFEPREVEMVRTVVSPDGTKQRTLETARIEGDSVSLEQQIDDGPIYGNTVNTPERPFVMGIEFIVARINPRPLPKFELREFNPQNGTIIVQRFKSQGRKEGGYRFWSTKGDGSISNEIVRDDTGRILSAKGGLPIEMRATTPKRVHKLRRQVGGR